MKTSVSAGSALAGALDSARRLSARVAPPVDRPEFWATQVLVLLVAGAHAGLELTGGWTGLEPLEFVPISLFLIPVVYAGLTFGLRGAAPTAVWCTILTIPNIFLWHHDVGRLGEVLQASFVLGVGFLVGNRIDRERRALDDAQRRELARRASEDKYRALFDAISEPTFVLDDAGAIQEANQAAGAMFDVQPAALRGRPIVSLVGDEAASVIMSPPPHARVRLRRPNGSEVWVEPLGSPVEAGRGRMQVVLHNVTHQREREEGLQAYTRHTLATREEERRRIARDLHDGPVQSLVLLWRRLDRLEQSVGEDAQPMVVELRRLAEEIADELRRFSRELRPSILDDLGLGPALRAEIAALSKRAAVDARYTETGSPYGLPPEAELMLLRIVQEALHNVERHARAASVLVRAAYTADALRVTVTDDGVGFEPPARLELLAKGKLGLAGMQERANVAGGELAIRSHRGRGTTVSVVVPAGGLP